MNQTPARVTDLLSKRTTSELVKDFTVADALDEKQNGPTIRGWIMDELERRDPQVFERWILGNPTVENLHREFNV